MLCLVLAVLVGVKFAAADQKPCWEAPGQTCCNPYMSPPEYCPNGAKCEPCGGDSACACPTSASPYSKRLKFINGCKSQPIWIAHVVDGGIGPDQQNVKIAPEESHQFTTAVNGKGLKAARFWPKMGCDSKGINCTIGDSGGPGEGCVVHSPMGDYYGNCAPPVDTKFEATFATPGSLEKDTIDMSFVDGFTLPFKLETTRGDCIRNGVAYAGHMDCSGMSLKHCPANEMLNGKSYNLRAINPKTGEPAGCYSPCTKLTDNKWQNASVMAASMEAGPYCCAGADATPDACQAITRTTYVTNMHAGCTDAYAFAYDDKRATICCDTTTEYHVTFYCFSTEEEPQIYIM